MCVHCSPDILRFTPRRNPVELASSLAADSSVVYYAKSIDFIRHRFSTVSLRVPGTAVQYLDDSCLGLRPNIPHKTRWQPTVIVNPSLARCPWRTAVAILLLAHFFP